MLLDLINNNNFIHGNWITSKDQTAVINPANDEIVGKVPDLPVGSIQAAIDSTVEGYKIWSTTSLEQRVAVLRKWHQLILDNIDILAHIITLEQGKILGDAKGEVLYAASFIEWYATVVQNIDATTKTTANHKLITEYEPLGPVAAITPWNFPSSLVTRKLAPAFAAGCSVILKPSNATPFSALALASLASDANLPPGVLNVITGKADLIGKLFCGDFRIRKLSFTGSTEVGKILYKNSSSTLKRMSMELGGNAPFIILADTDMIKTIEDLITAKIRSSGQSCISPNRIFIHESIHDKLIDALKEKFSILKVGDGLDPASFIGPLINNQAIAKILSLITEAKSKGAKVICGGNAHQNFLEPTIIINCNDDMEIFKTEIFGPVFACYKFQTVEEVIARANNTEYGLQSYIYTTNLATAQRIASAMESGMVAINTPLPSNAAAPFGGRKASGFGVEGSVQGIHEFLNTKYICL